MERMVKISIPFSANWPLVPDWGQGAVLELLHS